jgi:hypothetical protein
MKAQHRRHAPYRPRLEFAIGLLGLAICVIGVGLVTADVLEKNKAAVVPQEPTTTTTTMINSSVTEPETTTTVEPTTTTVPRPVGRVPVPVLKKAAVTVAPSSTTTTLEAPKTPLEVALKYLGQTGPRAGSGNAMSAERRADAWSLAGVVWSAASTIMRRDG